MKKIILTLVILLSFLTIAYCSEMPFYCYGECLKNEKDNKKIAILNAKKDCIEQLCLLFMYESDYKPNKDLIYSVINPDIDNYIITGKKTKFKEKDQKINDEKYKTVAFYCNVDIDTFFNKLKSIKGLEGKVAKPIVFIDAIATNHYTNTDESDILRSEMVQFFKDMCFNVLDRSIVDSKDNVIEKYKALKNANCEFYIQVIGKTEMKETESFVGNLLDIAINAYKKEKDGEEHDSSDFSKSMKELSSTSKITLDIYSLDTGKINKESRKFEGKAKGNVHIDNPGGVAHNSMKKAVEDFKENCPLLMYEATKTLDKNIFTLAVGNISNSDSQIIIDTIKNEDKNLVNIYEVEANYSKNYQILTKNNFEDEMSIIEKIKINNEPINIVYVENNIVGAYVNSDSSNSVTDTNYMEKLFNNMPESVIKNISVEAIYEFSQKYKQSNYYEIAEKDFNISTVDLSKERCISLANALSKDNRIINVKYNSDEGTFVIRANSNIDKMINIFSEYTFDNQKTVFAPLYCQSANSFGGIYVNNNNILYKGKKSVVGCNVYLVSFNCNENEYSAFIEYLEEKDRFLANIIYYKGATIVISSTNKDSFIDLLNYFDKGDKYMKVEEIKENEDNSSFITIQCSLSKDNPKPIKKMW